ncbi:MAG: glycosyltransferase [Candidatus Ozemobacteraceae bacterium]
MFRAYLARIRALRNLPRRLPLWFEKELFPWLPYAFERIFLRNRRYIIDMDDSVFDAYHRYPILRDKFANITHEAFEIHVGNRELAEDAQRYFSGKVRIFPTVLVPDEYAQKRENASKFAESAALDELLVPTGRHNFTENLTSRRRDQDIRESPTHNFCAGGKPLILGWIGSPLSQCHLEEFLPVLERVTKEAGIPVELHCMGTGGILPGNVRQKHFPWSPEAEKKFCSQVDVGIMPLAVHNLSRGKCGFKLLQFMAAGIPVIASESLANKDILENGSRGFLAKSPDDWRNALRTLFQSPDTRRLFGDAGKERVLRDFSLQAWAPRWCNAMLNSVNLSHASIKATEGSET